MMQKGRTTRHSLFYCKLKLVDFFHQGVQKLSFRHLADDLTFFENETLSLAAGDAEVSLALWLHIKGVPAEQPTH